MSIQYRCAVGVSLLLIALFSCKDDAKEASNIFGTWVVDRAEIEDNSAIPPHLKAEMEAGAKGKVWEIRPDSTIAFRQDMHEKGGRVIRFAIVKKDGRTLLTQGGDAIELKNIKRSEMDMVMDQGMKMTIHLRKE